MDLMDMEQLLTKLKQRQTIIFSTNSIEIIKKESVDGYADVAIGQIIPMYTILDSEGNILSSVHFTTDEKKPPIDGRIIRMLGEAFECNVILEDSDCEVFVHHDLRDYRYVLLKFTDMFQCEKIFPLEKDGTNDSIREVQPFYQILEGRKDRCTRYYGPFVDLPHLPLELPEIYTVFQIFDSGDKLDIAPLVFEENRSYIKPLPVLLAASFTGEKDESSGRVSAKYSNEVDRLLKSWRFIKHSPRNIIFNWEDIREILDNSRFPEFSIRKDT